MMMAGIGEVREIDELKQIGYGKDQLFDNHIECKWLSTVDAAKYLSVTENALRIMVHRNQICSYKFGRRLRFKLGDCQGLFEKKGT